MFEEGTSYRLHWVLPEEAEYHVADRDCYHSLASRRGRCQPFLICLWWVVTSASLSLTAYVDGEVTEEVDVEEGGTVVEKLDERPVSRPSHLECECIEETCEFVCEERLVIRAVEHADLDVRVVLVQVYRPEQLLL